MSELYHHGVMTAKVGKSYLENMGKEYTQAYVKDLGYNEEVGKQIVKKILSGGMSF